jgi:opacity protein-like surface antigen
MKKFLLVSSVAFGALMTPAIAADMLVKAAPQAPAWTWTGFYVGGNVGYAWGTRQTPTSLSLIQALSDLRPILTPVEMSSSLWTREVSLAVAKWVTTGNSANM